jgi:CxxC motif-containing protein (DUF1111 family)
VAAIVFGVALTIADEGPLPYRTDLDLDTRQRAAAILAPVEDFSKPQPFEAMSAGAATVRASGSNSAFSKFSQNLAPEEQADFAVGNGIFRKLWTPSPSSTLASDGLGPVFNSRACQRCHIKDGRGHPPPEGRYWENGEDAVSFVLGLSVPFGENDAEQPQTGSERVLPEPNFGGQLQDFSVPGLVREGRPFVEYETVFTKLNDGTEIALRKPTYRIVDPAKPLHPDVMISPRVANQMIGLGLLEAIHDEDLKRVADPDDEDSDQISGRLSLAVNAKTGEPAIGRFGWKAAQPTVRQQSAFAFATDMGLSTSLVNEPHGDCTELQTACFQLPTGEGRYAASNEPEVPDALLDLVAFYAANLGVPRRRDVGDPQVLRGKEIFNEIGCVGCHRPNFLTRDHETVSPSHRRQLIWPYTDLLLHDMGEDLADNRPQGSASGREWRTPPLWGIGLTQQVSGHTQFLHDGRARNLTEAVLWHGGEALAARDAFAAKSADARADLIRFLESL